jgi:HAD superfamily hydrolase (TIGR01484 family)
MSDNVDHPKHYNAGTTLDEDGTSKYEAIKIIEDWGYGEGFCVGNAIKYLLRAGHKEDAIEDLQKAYWYMKRITDQEGKKLHQNKLSSDIAANEWQLPKTLAEILKNLQNYSTINPSKQEKRNAFIRSSTAPLRRYISALNIAKIIKSKKLVLFDLDDTLTESKQPLSEEMARKLVEMSEHRIITIISGASAKQMNLQSKIINDILKEEKYERFADKSTFIYMPTCGTKIIKVQDERPELLFDEPLEESELQYIQHVIESTGVLAISPEETWGEVVEQRGSQITISFLGQEAPPEKKKEWDPDKSKRKIIQQILQSKLPDYEVKFGGSTSIDITKKGVDKAYGLMKLLSKFKLEDDKNINMRDVLFFGDALEQGGNDFPIKQLGVESIEVNSHQDCFNKLRLMFRTEMDEEAEKALEEVTEAKKEDLENNVWNM